MNRQSLLAKLPFLEFLTFKRVSNQSLYLGLMVAMAIHMIIETPGLIGVLLVALATAFVGPQYKKLSRRWGWIPNLVLILFASALAFAWLGSFVEPAHAQFFGVAEKFFADTFATTGSPGGAGDTVAFVFNVLRALFIIYVAVSFIGIVNAVRQDEDWQTAARTPIIIVLIVVLADILSTFILLGTGTGTGGGGGP